MKFITREWLNSAKSDLDTIKAILDHEFLTHIVAFHAQQFHTFAVKVYTEVRTFLSEQTNTGKEA